MDNELRAWVIRRIPPAHLNDADGGAAHMEYMTGSETYDPRWVSDPANALHLTETEARNLARLHNAATGGMGGTAAAMGRVIPVIDKEYEPRKKTPAQLAEIATTLAAGWQVALVIHGADGTEEMYVTSMRLTDDQARGWVRAHLLTFNEHEWQSAYYYTASGKAYRRVPAGFWREYEPNPEP